MRPLIDSAMIQDTTKIEKTVNAENASNGAGKFERKLLHLKNQHHSKCIFNSKTSIIPELKFWFDDTGVYHGSFKCNGYQQGYDNMVHGGVVAAVIDASMAQCLMGHGIIGYTANLTVKYCKPVMIRTVTTIETSIVAINCSVLYSMICKISQNDVCIVKADAKFFKVK